MKKCLGSFILGLTLLFVVQPAFAQTKQEIQGLQKEVESLKVGQTAIGKDLQEIKNLIQGMQRPPAAQGGSACNPSACGTSAQAPPAVFKEAIIDVKGAPIRGDVNAKLILVEFTDYECPYCQRYASASQPKITKEYIDTGKIRQVFMDFPLGMHKMAPKAAEAGLCAQDQGKFWEMSDKMFENPNKNAAAWLAPENLLKLAEGFGLDMTTFKTCLDSGKHAEDVKKRSAEAGKAGRTGAPAFYLGYMMPDGTVKATKQIKGAVPFETFKAAIDEMLAAKK
jgi:protein-disulfide isomerase